MTSSDRLDERRLNRTLLQRQFLLERSPIGVADAIERLVGLQAQTPIAPYVSLWSRLAPFDPADLSALIESRAAVRIGLLRTTIHLVTARDARILRPVLQPALDRAWSGSGFARRLADLEIGAVLTESRRLLETEPLTAAALGTRLVERWPGYDRDSLGYAARFLLPLVQVPPRGLWGRTGTARHTTLEAWTGEPLATSDIPDDLVLRYLAAYGPASVGDMRTWSWRTGLRESFERLRPRLRTYRDERNRELFDLADGTIADADLPAPPRFLPDYDNLLLSHDDRRRVVGPTITQQVIWDWGSLLIGGFVGGTWKILRAKEGATLDVKSFEPLAAPDRDAVTDEGGRLLQFMASGVPPLDVRIATDPDQHRGRLR